MTFLCAPTRCRCSHFKPRAPMFVAFLARFQPFFCPLTNPSALSQPTCFRACLAAESFATAEGPLVPTGISRILCRHFSPCVSAFAVRYLHTCQDYRGVAVLIYKEHQLELHRSPKSAGTAFSVVFVPA